MRITKLFEDLKAQHRPGLVGYLTAGDPTMERTPSLVAALERGGVDLIELGVPFSDPIADGPVIQRASDRALKAGATLTAVLQAAACIRKQSEIPLLLFTYLNPALRYGFEKLAKDAVAAGIDGCLLTDLSVEEAAKYVAVMREAGLDTVFMAAPTSTAARRELVASYSTGFIYLVSRTGVTGERDQLSGTIQPLIESMRAVTSLPLALGFGISTPEQAGKVGKVADAVVVGSAIVRLVEQAGGSSELEANLESYARSLRQSLDEVAHS